MYLIRFVGRAHFSCELVTHTDITTFMNIFKSNLNVPSYGKVKPPDHCFVMKRYKLDTRTIFLFFQGSLLLKKDATDYCSLFPRRSTWSCVLI